MTISPPIRRIDGMICSWMRLTNSLGTVSDNYLYKAFGIIAVSSGTTINPSKFVGRNGYYFDADLIQYLCKKPNWKCVVGGVVVGTFLSI